MEPISRQILLVLNPGSDTDTTLVKQGKGSKSLSRYSGTIDALNLLGRPVCNEDLLKAEELLKANYGINYSREKLTILWALIKEEGWTDERLMRTVKWVLKTKKYPNWTIADFFEYEVKLYPYRWYCEQINKGVKHEEMAAYRVNGKIYWTMDDGVVLPLEKI